MSSYMLKRLRKIEVEIKDLYAKRDRLVERLVSKGVTDGEGVSITDTWAKAADEGKVVMYRPAAFRRFDVRISEDE